MHWKLLVKKASGNITLCEVEIEKSLAQHLIERTLNTIFMHKSIGSTLPGIVKSYSYATIRGLSYESRNFLLSMAKLR